MKKTFLFSSALLLCATLGFGQAANVPTTLSSAAGSNDAVIVVASATGFTGLGALGQPTTVLLIDKELLYVSSVNGNTVSVLRGRDGIQAPHAAGAIVWFGPPSYFLPKDPSGYCVASNYPATPMLSVSGKVWTCNAVANQWGTTNVAYLSGAACGSKATTTTTTDNGMVPAATNNAVHQFTTNATGGTTEIACDLNLASRLDGGFGIVVTDVELLYGAQTTAISSIAAATVATVTYPASTASGASAAGTVASAGGTYTVTPTTLQKATTTSGQCYSEKVSFGTPIAINTDNQKLTFDQVFTNSAAATVYQVCGLLVHYYTPAL